MKIPKDKRWKIQKLLGESARWRDILKNEGNPREGEYTLSLERRTELHSKIHLANAEIVQLLRDFFYC